MQNEERKELSAEELQELADKLQAREDAKLDKELAELAGEPSEDTTDKARKYVGKYLSTPVADRLCVKLGIPTSAGGTAIFRAMLAKVLASK